MLRYFALFLIEWHNICLKSNEKAILQHICLMMFISCNKFSHKLTLISKKLFFYTIEKKNFSQIAANIFFRNLPNQILTPNWSIIKKLNYY